MDSGLFSSEAECSVSSCTTSPGGNKYFIPNGVDSNQIPYMDKVFDSLDKGFKFYKEYGRLRGFDIRKGTEKRDVDGTIVLKHFICSCEGFNEFERSTLDYSCEKDIKDRRTASKRCGCKAKFILKYMSPGKYFVYNFVEQHNHPLATEKGRQFLRVSREMNIGLRNVVCDGSKVNIGVSKTFSFVKEMVGGYSNVGATLQDFRNFSRDMKCYVGERDGQMIIDKFKVIQ